METYPETAILRFRDLATLLGDTVGLHQSLIGEKGATWWGWWSKLGETVPVAVFSRFKTLAENDNFPFILFDSGQQKLFEARCSDLRWDHALNKIHSPTSDQTPAYYRERTCLAWFRFTHISEIEDAKSKLAGFSYIRVDDFFEGGRPSPFNEFYGKQVSSIEELKLQERSIWFVRPFHEGDMSHEIRLLGGDRVNPSNFPEQFRQTLSHRLLWLSDLHCSTEHHAFPPESQIANKDFVSALDAALKKHEISDCAGVLVSGDITWQAKPAEFDAASSIYRSIISLMSIRPYDFCICPGNHDIAFSETPGDKNSQITRALSEARKPFDEHYRKMFFLNPAPEMCSGRRFLLGNAIPVEIAAFNSSLLQQEKAHFQGHGYLGGQLDVVSKEMGWKDTTEAQPRAFRIVMLHHHVVPVSYTELPARDVSYSVVLDAEAFVRWIIRKRVDLVLHGHMHQPFHTKITRKDTLDGSTEHTFDVVGLGSSGVKYDHLGEVGKNTFAELDFSTGRCLVRIYSIHPTNESTHIGKDIEIGGKPCLAKSY